MNDSRKKWLKCFNYLLAGMLVFLGFSSCMGDEETAPEYGHPYTRFEIKGKVVNSSEESLSDIQLIVKGITGTVYSEYVNSVDTLYSAKDGTFSYVDDSARPEIKYRIIHRDIDKTGNIRTYKTDSVNVDMPLPTEGNSFAEIEIKLKEKTAENNKQ